MKRTPLWPALLAASGLLLAAACLAQIPLAAWYHPAGWLMVLGGTTLATLLSTPRSTCQQALTHLTQGLMMPTQTLPALVDELVQLSHYTRKNGLLALSPLMPDFAQRIPFLHQGLEMATDNLPASLIKDRLATSIETGYQMTLDQARVFEAAAGYAPTMGLLGAILGLMQTLSGDLSEIHTLTTGVSSALSATLIGIALSNLLLLPLASRVRQQGRSLWFRQTLILQALLSVQAGEHPQLLKEKLSAYLSGQPVQETPAEEPALTDVLSPLPQAPLPVATAARPGSFARESAVPAFLPSSSPANLSSQPVQPTVASRRDSRAMTLPTPLPAVTAPARPKATAAYAQSARFQPPSAGSASRPAASARNTSATANRPLKSSPVKG